MRLSKRSFFRICAFLGILLASSIPVAAQGDEIYEIPGLSSKKSIVRYWKDMLYIVYSEDGGGSSFSLVDVSTMTCTSFSSNYLGVNDFEIAGKDVYFCGNNGTNPIAGFFDIPTLFSSATGMNYMSLGGWFPSALPGQERITDLIKLEVQRFPPFGCHVYMIGKAEYGNPASAVQNRCIVDLFYDGSWNYVFCQEQGSIYYYDDIVLTSTRIEVTGHKNGSSGYYNTQYAQPPNASTSFFSVSPGPIYYYDGGGGCYANDPHRPVIATHLFGNYYAMASYSDVCLSGVFPNDRGTVISIFNGSPSCMYRYFISQGYADTAYWEFKDFRYNKDTEKLYLLQEMSNPASSSLNSVICEFDVDNLTGAIISAKAFHHPGITFLSLDQCGNFIGATAVGGTSPIRLWHHTTGVKCVESVDIPLYSMSTLDVSNGYQHYPISSKCNPANVPGNLNRYGIIKICE